MSQPPKLHRWDEIELEKVTEMISRKVVTGEREMLAQIYLKKGAVVPMHNHESEQITYVLQGALKFLIAGEDITVREGEVLLIPSWVEHQAETLRAGVRLGGANISLQAAAGIAAFGDDRVSATSAVAMSEGLTATQRLASKIACSRLSAAGALA